MDTAPQDYDGEIEAAKKAAQWADVIVLAVGEAANYSGEVRAFCLFS